MSNTSVTIDRACYDRGCACYDPRVDHDGVKVDQCCETYGCTRVCPKYYQPKEVKTEVVSHLVTSLSEAIEHCQELLSILPDSDEVYSHLTAVIQKLSDLADLERNRIHTERWFENIQNNKEDK